jgi:hypothetical protein
MLIFRQNYFYFLYPFLENSKTYITIASIIENCE